ncbi:methyl-accepting chemotaxis protein [Clostridium ganghwense]|uniref:Methyl-accepting chemotaxis protein n=1 Tax=Clostridium ganghwense TaxID=312089 RepID=A0ABT4CMR7_9CLOT|nr:methyl-accepting chemotaxis protein [Clostridium ganghwense]MCY6370233.1 methyl-accepting chemotaxis protein [Clostridium ganghwense]
MKLKKPNVKFMTVSSKSIRTKIIAWFGISTTALLCILAFMIYMKTANTVVPLTQQMSEKIVEASGGQIGEWINGIIKQVELLAESDIVESMNPSLYKPHLIDMKEQSNEIEMYFIADKNGKMWNTMGTETDISDREYFKDIISGKKEVVVTNALNSKSTGKSIFIIATKIEKDGQIIGVLASTVTLDTLTEIAEKIKVGTSFGSVIDGNGLFIAHPDDNYRMKLNVLKSSQDGFKDFEKLGKDMVAGKNGVGVYIRPNGVEAIGLYATIPNTPNWTLLTTIPVGEMEKEANGMLRTISLMILLILIIIIGLSMYISKMVTKPIISSAEQLKVIATGDFTKELPEEILKRNDEFGELGKAVSKMQEDMKNLLSNIKESADTVNKSSSNLLEISQNSTRVASEMAEAINQIAISSSDQARDTEMVANKSNDLGERIDNTNDLIVQIHNISNETNELSEEGLRIINVLDEKTAESMSRTSEINEIILEVNQYANNAESITGLIDNISSQTNLLALNASIEAARAGEVGKGFAVVAEEIRKLSEETAAATNDIKALIGNIQEKANNAVSTMEEVKQITGEQNKSIENTGDIFNQTSESLKKLVDKIDKVNEYAEDMEESKNEIINAMTNVSAVTEETSASTEEVAASTEEQLAAMEEVASHAQTVNELGDELKNKIDKFIIE